MNIEYGLIVISFLFLPTSKLKMLQLKSFKNKLLQFLPTKLPLATCFEN